jgi:hypothetical protein
MPGLGSGLSAALGSRTLRAHLDAGIKVSYLKLQDMLAPIPWLVVKEE